MLQWHRNATRSPLSIDVRPSTAASRGVTRYKAPHTSVVGTSDDANALAPSGSISRHYQRRGHPRLPAACQGSIQRRSWPRGLSAPRKHHEFPVKGSPRFGLVPILAQCLASHSTSAEGGSGGAAANPAPSFLPRPPVTPVHGEGPVGKGGVCYRSRLLRPSMAAPGGASRTPSAAFIAVSLNSALVVGARLGRGGSCWVTFRQSATPPISIFVCLASHNKGHAVRDLSL